MRAKTSLAAGLLRLWLRSGIRGANRTSRFLAGRFPSLQLVPVQIADWPPVFVDLRDWSAQEWLRGSPWQSCPREADEQNIMQRFVRRGDVAYDIGANIGLHLALLSRQVGETGRVYAFEPNPALTRQLQATVAHMTNATLFTSALSNEEGDATLFVSEGDHSLSSLANWTAGRFQTSAVQCARTTLDHLMKVKNLPSPNFIKCDVEGGELDVFEGANCLLDRVGAPTILFEANIHTARGFQRELWSAGRYLEGLREPKYRFFVADRGGRLAPLTQPDPVHANILAVPESALGNWPELS